MLKRYQDDFRVPVRVFCAMEIGNSDRNKIINFFLFWRWSRVTDRAAKCHLALPLSFWSPKAICVAFNTNCTELQPLNSLTRCCRPRIPPPSKPEEAMLLAIVQPVSILGQTWTQNGFSPENDSSPKLEWQQRTQTPFLVPFLHQLSHFSRPVCGNLRAPGTESEFKSGEPPQRVAVSRSRDCTSFLEIKPKEPQKLSLILVNWNELVAMRTEYFVHSTPTKHPAG